MRLFNEKIFNIIEDKEVQKKVNEGVIRPLKTGHVVNQNGALKYMYAQLTEDTVLVIKNKGCRLYYGIERRLGDKAPHVIAFNSPRDRKIYAKVHRYVESVTLKELEELTIIN